MKKTKKKVLKKILFVENVKKTATQIAIANG